MEIIRELGLIIGLGYAGELASRLLPVRLPAGVLGIILVFSALSLGVLRPRYFGKAADFISANMAFFFLPLAVSILQNFNVISPLLFRLIAICVISTLVTFAASYGTVRLFRLILGKGDPASPAAGSPHAGGASPRRGDDRGLPAGPPVSGGMKE
ncbi:MAG: CidA/LrgA family protein [Treponema sp.]|jgi:holin-like protein|nr:CidA/LrgA family protein [Treponema sp.]